MFDFLKKSVKEAQEIDAALTACKMEPEEVYNKVVDKVCDEDKWIWVPGYKATDWYMRGYDNYQFEMGKEFHLPLDEEPELCKRGFHFCPKAKFIKRYANQGRLFKVEVLVKEADWIKAKTWLMENPDGTSYWAFQVAMARGCRTEDYMKMVGKAVRFIEEIPTEEAWEHFPRRHYVDNAEDFAFFSQFIADGHVEEDFYLLKWKEGMMKYDISETLCNVLFDEIHYKSYSYKVLQYFSGLMESGVSRDMAIYLLTQHLKEYRQKEK